MRLVQQLPNELVIEAFKLLSLVDLLKCRRVALSWKTTIDSDVVLQYRLLLEIAGMKDGAPSRLPCSRRLALLREHQRAWSSLQWREACSIRKYSWATWELYGNVFAQGMDEKSIMFQPLPSRFRDTLDSLPWEVKMDFKIRDFGMDPSRDLLVLLEVVKTDQAPPNRFRSQIHIVTMTEGLSHPEAAKGKLEYNIEHFTPDWSYTIQTHGELLGILYEIPRTVPSAGRYHLVIWNWRTGVVCSELPPIHDIESFAFLDDWRFVIGRIPFPIDEEQEEEGADLDQPLLQVYSLAPYAEQPIANKEPRWLATLEYPALAPGAQAFELSIRTDPSGTWTPPAASCSPFYVAPDERIFVVKFYVMTEPRARPILQCISHNMLLKIADDMEGKSKPLVIDWEDWGPMSSRMWIDEDIDDTWVCYVYGPRFVLTNHEQSDSQEARVQVVATLRDFSPRAVRHGQHLKELASQPPSNSGSAEVRDTISGSSGIGEWQYHAENTVIDDPLVERPVVTSLPYREVERILPHNISKGGPTSIMLSENALVVVDMQAQEYGRQITVLSF